MASLILTALLPAVLASSAGKPNHCLSLSEEEGARTWTDLERA